MSPAKRELRSIVRAGVAALDPAARRLGSDGVCARLAALPELASARTVLLYLPLPGEIDVLPFGRRLLAGGVVVAVPRVAPAGAAMEAVAVERLPRDGAPGGVDGPEHRQPSDAGDFAVDRLGVRSPVGGRVLPVQAIDAIIVPGLAFDSSGARLGRGGGFYDRFLAGRSPRCVAVGVCFDVQLVERVPLEPHDALVDVVLSEHRLVYTRRVDTPMRP